LTRSLAPAAPAARPPTRPGLSPGALGALGLALGAAVLAALHVARGLDYWNYSEGVYALTARLLLRGHDVYGDVVAAQPPWSFLVGAGALAVDDSLGWLRLALGAVQLGTGLLAARAVWRLTESRPATIAAPALALLTPWAVHEHGSLTPEVVAPPLLLGAALAGTAPWSAPVAGVLVAAAAFVKLPFLLAVPAVVALSARRRRTAAWAAGALAVQAVLFTALFGTGLWDHTVVAQLDSGRRALGDLPGIAAQAIWSLAGLVALALAALAGRAAVPDAPLLRMLAGLSVAVLLTLATTTKSGTSLNVIVPIEAVLLPLALAGAVVLVRSRAALGVAAAVCALAFVFVQTASLLVSSPTATPFTFPTAERGAWGMERTGAEVERQAAAARHCPSGAPYGGPPLLAFVADRPMPADQPDQFLTERSGTLAGVRREIAAAGARCP
jgi:hypothetical protein